MSDSADIAARLRGCKTVLISAHKSPDGDALGSQLGLMLALEKLHIEVCAHNLDPVPEIYRFLPHADRIQIGKPVAGRYDAHVVVDSDPPRTGLFDADYPADVLINIDHHLTNPREWPLTWLAPGASACGEMVYQLIQDLGVPLDREIALCLYTAIFTDTGSFRYTNTTPECMRIAAVLIEAGADPWLVTENVYESFAYRRLKLLGMMLTTMMRNDDGRIAWITVTDEQYRQTGTTAEDTDNFVNYVRSVKGVEVAVLFRQTGTAQYKFSLRSKGRVDLSGVAQSFGGGGHQNAAGGTLDGSIGEVTKRVIGEIEKTMRTPLGQGGAAADGGRS